MMIDTNVLLRGTWMEAVRLPGLGRDLLKGHHYDSAPSFELWLTNERARLSAASEAILHEATLATLAQRNHGDALEFATRLLSLNRYDENNHVLLARVLRSSGDVEAAERQVAEAVQLFRKELGVEPSASFRAAALSDSEARITHPSASTVAAQLEAGEAAITAGAWQAGLEALRGAAAASLAIDDDLLKVRAHLGLGSALVHAARGLDEEGATNLHRAASLADEKGQATHAAKARRELAWVELLRGRYERARTWLDEAAPLAEKDDAEYAWIAGVRGACESDVANYPAALSFLETAIELAERAGAEAPGAFAHNMLGRLYLLHENLDHARTHIQRSLELARDASWTAFVPFPMSLLAEVQLLSAEVETARDTYERLRHELSTGRSLLGESGGAGSGSGRSGTHRSVYGDGPSLGGTSALPPIPRLLPVGRGLCPGGTMPGGGEGPCSRSPGHDRRARIDCGPHGDERAAGPCAAPPSHARGVAGARRGPIADRPHR